VFYTPLAEVLRIARLYNENPDAPQYMAPNGAALNLKYPKVDRNKNVPILF
jgi:hypothetical protein